MTIKTVTLDTPIPYGDGTLTEITLRCPQAGDLRGLKLNGLGDADVDTILALVPRIATPVVASAQLWALAPPDFLTVTEVVAGFFLRPPPAQ